MTLPHSIERLNRKSIPEPADKIMIVPALLYKLPKPTWEEEIEPETAKWFRDHRVNEIKSGAVEDDRLARMSPIDKLRFANENPGVSSHITFITDDPKASLALDRSTLGRIVRYLTFGNRDSLVSLSSAAVATLAAWEALDTAHRDLKEFESLAERLGIIVIPGIPEEQAVEVPEFTHPQPVPAFGDDDLFDPPMPMSGEIPF